MRPAQPSSSGFGRFLIREFSGEIAHDEVLGPLVVGQNQMTNAASVVGDFHEIQFGYFFVRFQAELSAVVPVETCGNRVATDTLGGEFVSRQREAIPEGQQPEIGSHCAQHQVSSDV